MKGFKKFLNKDLMVLQTPTVKLTIFGLAIPLFFESIGAQIIAMIQTMLSSNFMDGFFVSPMSIALSASAPITSLSQSVTMGLSVVLSINLGRGKDKDSAKIIGSAMYANVLFSIFLNSIVAVLAEPLISFMGYSGPEYIEQFPYAVDYLQKQSIVMIVLRITTGFMVILRCYGYTKIGMYSTLISSSVLAVFTAFMLYVISPAKEDVVNGFIICRLLVRIGELIIIYFIMPNNI
jgi:Na+-driven multidrug efflux pump